MIEMALIGRITTDIELRKISRNGQTQSVTTLPIAINNRRRNADGVTIDEVTYVNVSVWGVMAENAVQYLGKGRRVYVHGTPRARAFTRNNGEIDAALELRADRLEFLDGQSRVQPQHAPNYDAPQNTAAPVATAQPIVAAPAQAVAAPVTAQPAEEYTTVPDDNLPF